MEGASRPNRAGPAVQQRGHGEPLRLMIDREDRVGIVDVFVHKPGAKRILASKEGYGFILPEEDAIAFRRASKQVLNPGPKGALVSLLLGGADQLAVIGDNGKTSPRPNSPRCREARASNSRPCAEGGLRDATAFAETDGAAWIDTAGRTSQWAEWREWLGKRAGAGKLAPRGFPASKRFRPR